MPARFLALVLVTALAACASRSPLPPPPAGVATIAVAPVENKTGSDLVVQGDWFIARYLGRKRRTVADVLVDEARTILRDRGFAVATGGGLPTLRMTLSRFEPDLPQLDYVEVAMTATLTDPDGTVRWQAKRSHWLVSTQGAPSLAAAYDAAAHTVARQLLDGWTAAR